MMLTGQSSQVWPSGYSPMAMSGGNPSLGYMWNAWRHRSFGRRSVVSSLCTDEKFEDGGLSATPCVEQQTAELHDERESAIIETERKALRFVSLPGMGALSAPKAFRPARADRPHPWRSDVGGHDPAAPMAEAFINYHNHVVAWMIPIVFMVISMGRHW